MSIDRRRETLTLDREISATLEEIFRALTDPVELMKWWGAKGTLTGAQVNLRPGGEYRFELIEPAGRGGVGQGTVPGRRASPAHPEDLVQLEVSGPAQLRRDPPGTGARRHAPDARSRRPRRASPRPARNTRSGWPDVLGKLGSSFK